MKSIVIESVAEHFRVNMRVTRSCMIEFFDNQRGPALAHPESIAQQIERTTSQSRIAWPSAHRFYDVECSDRDGRQGRFRSSGDNHIGKIIFNIHPVFP